MRILYFISRTCCLLLAVAILATCTRPTKLDKIVVTDKQTGQPIAGAQIIADIVNGPENLLGTTNTEGVWQGTLPTGGMAVTVRAPGYEPKHGSLNIDESTGIWLGYELTQAPFIVEIVPIERLRSDQIEYHSGLVSAEDVLALFDSINQGLGHEQGQNQTVFAHGYAWSQDPLHWVFAPINGGRIGKTPGEQFGYTFYDSESNVLVYLKPKFGEPRNLSEFRSSKIGGSGSNRPNLEEGARNFHYIYGISKKPSPK